MEDGWGMLKRFQILFPEIQPRPILDPPPLPLRNRGNGEIAPSLFCLRDDKRAHDVLLRHMWGLRIACVCSHFSPVHAIGRRFEQVPRYMNPLLR